MTLLSTFKRYGLKAGYSGHIEMTVLLVDIKDVTGRLLTDHVWFKMNKSFDKLGVLSDGDIIQFDARVKRYLKGYRGDDEMKGIGHPLEYDYKLSNPTKLRVINKLVKQAELNF